MLKKFILFAGLGLGALSFTGCIFLAAGAAGVGTAKWLSDKVTQEVDQPRADVVKAAKSVMQEMKLNVYKTTVAPDVTQLLAKNAAGRQVWVDVRPIDAKNTKVDVRVGYANGEKDAADILNAIVKKAKSWF